MSEPEGGATFQIEKIYVKDVSLEIPNAPHIFLQPAQPQLEVQIDTSAAPFAEGYFEATVSATVTAKVGDKTLFLAEAVQAGIFQMRNVPADDLKPLLGIACPTILFPYLREAISDLVIRGGFPPGAARAGVVRGAVRAAPAATAARRRGRRAEDRSGEMSAR